MSISSSLIKKFFWIFLLTRFIYTGAGLFAREHFLDKNKPFPSWTYESELKEINVWTSWDSGFYKEIAENGYPRILQPKSKTIIKVEPRTWVRVFLGYGLLGTDRVPLPSYAGIPYNNNLFLIGAWDKPTEVELASIQAGVPYCVYRGPIDFERDVLSTSQALSLESTGCGGVSCGVSFLTYYSASENRVLYQEYFEKPKITEPVKKSGEYRPTGFTDESYQGLGCKSITEGDLEDNLSMDVRKTTSPFPFMPLYPYVTGILSAFFGDTVVSGLVLSNLAFFLSILLFYKLISLDFNPETSVKITYAYIFYPFMFLSSAFLTEGLFNFLLFLTLYLVRTKKYILSVITFSLLSVTRINGVFALIPILLFIYKQEKIREAANIRALFYILSLTPLVFHISRLTELTGDPMIMLNAQRGFGREGEGIFAGLINYFLFSKEYGDFEFLILALAGYLCYRALSGLRKDGKVSYIPYLSLCIYNLILPLSTGVMTSFPRFSMGIFPIFIGMGTLFGDTRRFNWLLGISFAASLLFMVLWTISSRYIM